MTNLKCKPGQGEWVLLKLESCCDVIKRLFSTARPYGWTRQRFSPGILGREWLQRRQMFRLRRHNYELTKIGKPAS